MIFNIIPSPYVDLSVGWKKYKAIPVYNEGVEKFSKAAIFGETMNAALTADFSPAAGTWTLGTKAIRSLETYRGSNTNLYDQASGHTLSYYRIVDRKHYSDGHYEITFSSGTETDRSNSGKLSISGYPGYTLNSDGTISPVGEWTTYEKWYDDSGTGDATVYIISGRNITKKVLTNSSMDRVEITEYDGSSEWVVDSDRYEYTANLYTKTAAIDHYERGDYVEDVVGNAGDYPDNGYKNGYWYVRA